MRIKRYVSCLLASCMILGLAGCGDKDSSKGDSKEGSTKASTSATTDDADSADYPTESSLKGEGPADPKASAGDATADNSAQLFFQNHAHALRFGLDCQVPHGGEQ